MRRLAIYVHYDKNGDVKDYVTYCLKGLQEVVTDILVIVNGELNNKGKKALEALGVDILVRENEGYDFCAWKEGIERYGYDKVAEYDELLLTNNTFYGPIYPFSEMWDKMDKVDCDFWGINRHSDMNHLVLPDDPNSKILEHIQSYWLVFKKRILKTHEFKSYWENIQVYSGVKEIIVNGEIALTNYFENAGFKSATYMDFDKYLELLPCDNSAFLTYMQVTEDRCPVVKRKYFYDFEFKPSIMRNGIDDGPMRLLELIDKDTGYDVNMIWDDLLSIAKLSELNDILALNYILPSAVQQADKQTDKKVVCIMYLYYEELVGYFREHIDNLPDYIDVVLVSVFDNVVEACKKAFKGVPNKIEYRVQQNRGRENTGLLVTCKDIIKKYDYLCIVHGKMSKQNSPVIQSEEFRNHNFKSLLYSKDYVDNIVATFDKNPRLGVLVPFAFASSLYLIIGNEIGIDENRQSMLLLFNEYFKRDINNFDKHVIFPAGGMYWARTSAMNALTSYDWQFEDFPEEPMPATDGILPHAIERSICLAAQTDGYYSAFVAPDKYGSAYLNDLHYLRKRAEVTGIVRQEPPIIVIEKKKDFRETKKYILKYLRYKFLSKTTFGKTRKRYKQKRNDIKKRFD